MKVVLKRIPYLCPVLEDHTGLTNGHYIFNEKWYDVIIDLEILEENETFWIAKIATKYEGMDGWLKCELMKELFSIIEQ